MRTRSNGAKRRPQLLSLPTDLLPSIGAFTSDVDAALLAISSKRARSTLTHAVWSAILRSNHGGLRIAAGDDGLRVARHLWAVRGHSSDPVSPDPTIDGFFALSTNCAPAPYAAQSYWTDGLFRRETWRMYSTKQTGGAPVLAVAAFLAIGDFNEEPLGERSFLLDHTETNANSPHRLDLQRHSTTSASLAAVFLDIWGSMGDGEAEEYHESEHIPMILERCAAIRRRCEAAGVDQEDLEQRSGLDATVFEDRGDGITADPRVEGIIGQFPASTPMAIATGVVVRRPMECTCPGRAGIIFGLRRLPRVFDINADSHMQRLVTAAAPLVRTLVVDGRPVDLTRDAEDDLGRRLGGTRPVRLPVYDWSDESNGDRLGVCYQLLGGDEDADVFPLAVFCFSAPAQPTLENYRTDLHAKLRAPAALQGLALAVVDVENFVDGPQQNPSVTANDPNVDMEFVGIQGYVYYQGQ